MDWEETCNLVKHIASAFNIPDLEPSIFVQRHAVITNVHTHELVRIQVLVSEIQLRLQ